MANRALGSLYDQCEQKKQSFGESVKNFKGEKME